MSIKSWLHTLRISRNIFSQSDVAYYHRQETISEAGLGLNPLQEMQSAYFKYHKQGNIQIWPPCFVASPVEITTSQWWLLKNQLFNPRRNPIDITTDCLFSHCTYPPAKHLHLDTETTAYLAVSSAFENVRFRQEHVFFAKKEFCEIQAPPL